MAASVVENNPELEAALHDMAVKFLYVEGDFAKVVYVEGSGYHKLANTFAGIAAVAEKWQHLLMVTRNQYELALARRPYDGAAQPAKLSDREMRDLMNLWRNKGYKSWCQQWKRYEAQLRDPKAGSHQRAHKRLHQAFSVYLMGLCGCKPLVSVLIQDPIHLTRDAVAWCRAFLQGYNQYMCSREYLQALAAARAKTETQKECMRRVHALRFEMSRAKSLHHIIHHHWEEWYSLSEADRELYKRFKHGYLQWALQHANEEYGCSFISRGGPEAVGDFLRKILRLPPAIGT